MRIRNENRCGAETQILNLFMMIGKDWFNMAALELTEERKNDLELLQMRGALDPKR
jgi:hypothetical protein